MKVNIEKEDDIVIVNLSGNFIAGKIEFLKDKLSDIIREDNVKIILNFSDVDFIDSSGVGTIINILKNITKKNGSLKIANINSKVKDIFAKLRILSFFDIYDSVDEAIESF